MTSFDYYFQRSCPVDFIRYIQHALITIFERRQKDHFMSTLNELCMLLFSSPLSPSSSSLYRLAFAPSSAPPVFVPTVFNFQVVALIARFPRVRHSVGSPINFKVGILLVSLAPVFFFILFPSLVIYPQCHFCSGCLLFLIFYPLPPTAPRIRSCKRILKFPVGSLALGNAITWAAFFLHLFLRYRFVFQVIVFFYSYFFQLDPLSAVGFSGFAFFSNIARLFGRIKVTSCILFVLYIPESASCMRI